MRRTLNRLRSFPRYSFGVMRGLDPRIHDEVQARKVVLPLPCKGLMDCRVKPGNDSGEVDGPDVTGSTLI
jgi:hypothetical protein